MIKQRIFIILVLIFGLMVLVGCGLSGEVMEPAGTPSAAKTPAPAPAPTPTSAPTPSPTPAVANIVDIPDEESVKALGLDGIEETPFFVEITNTEDVVLVEFWSADNTYSADTSEVLAKVSRATGVKIVRVNVDENPELANAYGLVVLPTVYVFLGGQQVDGVLGAAPYEAYAAMVDKYRQ